MNYPVAPPAGATLNELFRAWIENAGVTPIDPSVMELNWQQVGAIASFATPVGSGGAANALAQTTRRSEVNAVNIATVSGDLYLFSTFLAANTVVSDISFLSGTTGATAPTHWWFGLYDNLLNQLAVTADQTNTAWAASTPQTLAVATTAAGAATSFTTTYSGIHYLGFLMTAGTNPTLTGATSSAATNTIPPVAAGLSDTAQTIPPAFPHAATALTAQAGKAFAYLT
jgi:hypothetical protein